MASRELKVRERLPVLGPTSPSGYSFGRPVRACLWSPSALIVRVRKRKSMKVFTPASGTQGVGEWRGVADFKDEG